MPSLRLAFVWRLLSLIALLVLPALAPAYAQNTSLDSFAVRGVDVDVTAANPQQAKDQAVAEGQRRAFRMLLERLVAPADQGRIPKADGVEYVRDFSVQSERWSSTRYIATLMVRFNPNSVRKLLQGANIAYAEPRSRAVVVVPVYRPGSGGRTLLWDEGNAWRAAWASLGGGGLVPLVLPVGDAADMQTITPEQAVAGNAEALQALGARWRSPDVMVVAAGLAPNGKTLDVTLQAGADVPKPFDTKTYTLADGESVDALLLRAARDIDRSIDAVFKQPNTLQFDRAGTIPAMIPLAGMGDWLDVRERLGRVNQVRRWELVSLSKTEAAVVLHVVGDQDQVRTALGGAGLALETQDGLWTLRVIR